MGAKSMVLFVLGMALVAGMLITSGRILLRAPHAEGQVATSDTVFYGNLLLGTGLFLVAAMVLAMTGIARLRTAALIGVVLTLTITLLVVSVGPRSKVKRKRKPKRNQHPGNFESI